MENSSELKTKLSDQFSSRYHSLTEALNDKYISFRIVYDEKLEIISLAHSRHADLVIKEVLIPIYNIKKGQKVLIVDMI